jgi:hypothetical protein
MAEDATSSSLRSIVGTGAGRSIVGTGAGRSIVGTGAGRSIVGTGAGRSIVGTGAPRSAYGSDDVDVVVFGGLEGVAGGRLDVMGQEFDISGLALDEEEMRVQVGRLIYVEATKGGDGVPTAVAVQTFDGLSIPGATAVFVRGSVDAVDSATGKVSMGRLQIDVTNAQGPALAVGEELSVTGTQPLPSGLILGTARL